MPLSDLIVALSSKAFRTPMKRTTAEHLASLTDARMNCARTAANTSAPNENRANANEWFKRHTESIHEIMREHMPSGSGLDSGVQFDLERSAGNRLVFHTSFHHMTEGCYTTWTDHTLIARPSFIGRLDLSVGGRNTNDIKDYLADLFREALSVEWDNNPDAKPDLWDLASFNAALNIADNALLEKRDALPAEHRNRMGLELAASVVRGLKRSP